MRRTKMRTMSDRRRELLAKAGIEHPTSTFTPKKPKMATAKRPTNTGPDAHTVDLVLARDHWQCVVCGDPLHGRRGRHWSLNHRKLKSQGVDNRPCNLIAVCGDGAFTGCHAALHASPAKAYLGGWLLRSTDDPAAVPVIHFIHGHVRLTVDGGHTQYREACA
jgi:hypothetical protein